jgi:hypothetical protein
MPLPESSISIVCNAINQFVRNSVNAAANNIAVSTGAPAEVADNDEEHRVNLFFYRFEPGGFQSAAHPNDPWRVRIFCLITVFGILEDGISAGENELRLLGEIMRIFREQPVMNAVGVSGEQVRLQVIFSPATDEQINQVWSTQGDTSYRPSLIYEMALAPVMPSSLRSQPPLVGALGTWVRADNSGRHAAFAGQVAAPAVAPGPVSIADPLWRPVICWIRADSCHHTLSLNVDDPAFAGFAPQLWLAGDAATSVNLIWEIWDNTGWHPVGAPVPATPFGNEITPDAIPPAVPGIFPLVLALPVVLAAGESAAQALLYAERRVTPVPGGDEVIVRSNPLLISLYRGVV